MTAVVSSERGRRWAYIGRNWLTVPGAHYPRKGRPDASRDFFAC